MNFSNACTHRQVFYSNLSLFNDLKMFFIAKKKKQNYKTSFNPVAYTGRYKVKINFSNT